MVQKPLPVTDDDVDAAARRTAANLMRLVESLELRDSVGYSQA
jgi:hypothetical protein